MLFLRGEKDVLQTINVLTKPYQIINNPISYDSLKIAYHKLLTDIQPEIPHSDSLNTDYINDIEVVKEFMTIFSTESLVDDTFYDIEQSRDHVTNEILDKTKSSASKLGEKYPPFNWIFNLTMDSVFNASSQIASGGTTSGAVGILFANPRNNYTDEDMYEFLVHELGHTLLFIYEWRFKLFNDPKRIIEPTTYALSAIRNQLRPMDKALHSVIVAVEILLLRDKVLGHDYKHSLHPSTHELIPMVNASIESILNTDRRENMLTGFGKTILNECKTVLQNYNTEVI